MDFISNLYKGFFYLITFRYLHILNDVGNCRTLKELDISFNSISIDGCEVFVKLIAFSLPNIIFIYKRELFDFIIARRTDYRPTSGYKLASAEAQGPKQ